MNFKGTPLAWTPLMILLAACGGGGAGSAAPPKVDSALDAVAERYVKLVLAVGRHDDLYVDAYYGPPAWKTVAAGGAPTPLPELLAQARALQADLGKAGGPADRKRYLEKQLVAVEGHLRRLSGEKMTLAEECRVLYDADPPHHDAAEFEEAQRKLEALVPGKGPLGPRIEAMRRSVYIPHDKIAPALAAALQAARTATAPFVKLPEGEQFVTALVTGKPWGAYNWYLGNYKSRIELNTDLPVEANNLLGTMCHEGYPGHHVYNVLLERNLVKGKGWVEYTVYPLYSPQSLLAEGSANAGIDIVFTPEERRRTLTGPIAEASGVDPKAIAAVDAIRDAMKPLRYVSGEAARMLLDNGKPDAEVAEFIRKWGLVTEERSKKSIDFARTYRSYVFNYSLGEDVVRAYIGDGPDRARKFFDILSRPVVPSDLTKGQ
ncbi:MAG TPA: hypothetical protein VFV19_02050 [Candidatus Polarisedimenticolaceae bacterium]|nr:hypothetical protein [Candidatus Polarisedimenticolaceae bacterium]